MSIWNQAQQSRDQLRRELLDMCQTAATRVRTTYVSDGAGGRTASSTASDALSVFVAPKASIEQEIAGRLTEDSDFVMYVSVAEDVVPSDVVTIGASTYEIVEVLQPATLDVLRVAGLKRLN